MTNGKPARRIFCLAATALTLAACDSLSVRTVGDPTALYKIGDLDYAGNGRDTRVVVLDDGKILGGHEALQRATIAGLQSNVAVRTRFTAMPENHNRDFKVVLMFVPADEVSAQALCREPAVTPRFAPSDASRTLHVLAAFCRAGDVLTEVDGYARDVKDANENRFKVLMTAVTRKLFPARDLRVEETPE